MRKKIGDFQMGKTVGEGTFGKVHQGIHLPTGEKVGIKVLEKEKILEKQDLQRVQRQLMILRKLDHPNIVKLLELHETQKNIYIITQYIEGQELYQQIVEEGKLSEHAAKLYFAQLLQAVSYLHRNSISHRDIKPQNIMVASNRLKLIDFGLSKSFSFDQLLSTSCGSPCYAAPEMLSGKKYNAIKTDIWALGVTLYAMVAGKLPFEHNKTNRLYQMVHEGKYQKLQNVSSSLSALIKGMLQVNPNERISFLQIRESNWLSGFTVDKEEDISDELIIESMCSIFSKDKNQILKILTKKTIPSLYTFYYLTKSSQKQKKTTDSAELLLIHEGPLNLNFIFQSLKEIGDWLEENMKGYKKKGKFKVEYKGSTLVMKKVKRSNLYYLDMPSYLTQF